MRPHLNLRARHAAPALGAICLAVTPAVLPGTAVSAATTAAHGAVAADIAPGKSRLNQVATTCILMERNDAKIHAH